MFCRLPGCVSVPERESRVASSPGEHCFEGECKAFAPLICRCLIKLCLYVLTFFPCQDLQSTNLIEVCMALTVLSQIFPKEMIPAILPLVEEKLNHPKYDVMLLIYIKYNFALTKHQLSIQIEVLFFFFSFGHISREIIRRKAVLALYKFYLIAPNQVQHIHNKFRKALCDKDPGVMTASLHIYLSMIQVISSFFVFLRSSTPTKSPD